MKQKHLNRTGENHDSVQHGLRRTYFFRILRFLSFAAVCLVVVILVNRIITPTYIIGTDSNGETSTYQGFYSMEENTVDVLLLGSSQMGCGINPQDMYDAAGIRSYNLASDGQQMWISYYWLREALNYQSPKVVVLECYVLFEEDTAYELGSRKALNEMRYGVVKREAVKTVCALDESQTYLSYFLPNIRYHERWDELTESDFTWMDMEFTFQSKGFYCVWKQCGDDNFKPLSLDEAAEVQPEEFDAYSAYYLDKITELCEEEGIELILLKTPTYAETLERNLTLQNYADEHGLKFYDFNTEELYNEIEFDYAADMLNSSTTGNRNAHANVSGARKMSIYLAEQLTTVHGVEPVEDEQYDEGGKFNDCVWQAYELYYEEDPVTYLTRLNQDHYVIFFSGGKGISYLTNEAILEGIQELGLTFDMESTIPCGYLAVWENGSVTEELTDSSHLSLSGTVNQGRVGYTMSSGTREVDQSSIVIDEKEYSDNGDGLNIVVYDSALKRVIDQACLTVEDGTVVLIR